MSAQFEGDDDLWWVTGGRNGTVVSASTEMFSESANQFTFKSYLPIELEFHEMVNINNSHTIVLGDETATSNVYLYDRY